jgi:hypothetical protein
MDLRAPPFMTTILLKPHPSPEQNGRVINVVLELRSDVRIIEFEKIIQTFFVHFNGS